MRPAEMRERTDGDLAQMEVDLRRDLWKARFDNYTNQLDDTGKLRRLRRDLARVKTILTERARQASREATKE